MLRDLHDAGPLAFRPLGWVLTTIRCASGIVFISFGVGKFVNHASETASFHGYGLPVPSAFTYVVGALELVGGLLLLGGLGTRLIALLLAGDMIGAIVVSGVLQDETVSLTLAPALLVAMLALVAFGPGQASLDARAGGA